MLPWCITPSVNSDIHITNKKCQIRRRNNTIQFVKHVQKILEYIFLFKVFTVLFLTTVSTTCIMFLMNENLLFRMMLEMHKQEERHFTCCLWPMHAFMMNSAVYKKLAAVNEMKWWDMAVRLITKCTIRSAMALQIKKSDTKSVWNGSYFSFCSMMLSS